MVPECSHTHQHRGEFECAVEHLKRAMQRLTLLNPNPYDGEALYALGITLRMLSRDDEAYDVLYKATWNYAWQAAAFVQLAQIDCRRQVCSWINYMQSMNTACLLHTCTSRCTQFTHKHCYPLQDWSAAEDHLLRALAVNAPCNLARSLLALVRARTKGASMAPAPPGPIADWLEDSLKTDPLDWCAQHLLRGPSAVRCDAQTAIDLAIDYMDAGKCICWCRNNAVHVMSSGGGLV